MVEQTIVLRRIMAKLCLTIFSRAFVTDDQRLTRVFVAAIVFGHRLSVGF